MINLHNPPPTSSGGGGAPTDAQYVAMALNGSLSAERVLTAGSSIALIDGGANGNATLNFIGGLTPSGDLAGTWVTPTVKDLTITGESAGTILKFDGSNWIKMIPGDAGSVLAVAASGTDLTFIAAAGGAPSNATYIVQSLNGTLTDERVITGGSAIGLVDGGANGNMTINFDGGTTPSGDLGGTWTTPTVTDLTIASEAQGSVLYRNATNWVQLTPGTSGHFLKTNGAAANPEWAAGGGGGGTWFKHLQVQSAKLTGDDIASSAAIDAGDRGWRLLMDDTLTEEALWQFVVDPNYAGGSVSAEVLLSMTSAQADASVIAIAGKFMATTGSAIAAAGDKWDWNTSRYAATQTSNHALGVGYSAGYVQRATIPFTFAQTSSMAINDIVRFHIERANVESSAAGDLEILGVVLHE